MALTILYGIISLLYLEKVRLTKSPTNCKEVKFSFLIDGKTDCNPKKMRLEDLDGKRIAEIRLRSVEIDTVISTSGPSYNTINVKIAINPTLQEKKFNFMCLSEPTKVKLATFSLIKAGSEHKVVILKEDKSGPSKNDETSLISQNSSKPESKTLKSKEIENSSSCSKNQKDQNFEFLNVDEAFSDEFHLSCPEVGTPKVLVLDHSNKAGDDNKEMDSCRIKRKLLLLNESDDDYENELVEDYKEKNTPERSSVPFDDTEYKEFNKESSEQNIPSLSKDLNVKNQKATKNEEPDNLRFMFGCPIFSFIMIFGVFFPCCFIVSFFSDIFY